MKKNNKNVIKYFVVYNKNVIFEVSNISSYTL